MNKLLLSLAAAVMICFAACAQKKGNSEMKQSKTLVAYFSATGTTAQKARTIAQITGGDLFAITPETAYTNADLDWTDKQSRSSVEMNDPNARPALKEQKADLQKYDVVFIGYPIWWDLAPRIINTFVESHNLKGKTLILFATSGGSGIDNSVKELKKTYPDLTWQEGKLLNHTSENEIKEWIEGVLN